MRASVVIPAFNRGYILAEAIQSVLLQTHSFLELIVVDDGSTDNTCNVVKTFTDNRIKLIRHPRNSGVAAARNSGLAAAKGDLVAFLDSDDLWDPAKLARDAAFLVANPGIDAVFSDLKYEGKQSISSVVRSCPEFSGFLESLNASASEGVIVPRRTMYLCMLQEMPIKIQAITFRRGVLGESWKFHEAWKSGEDWEFLLRFVRNKDVGFIDQPLVLQRAQEDSTFARYRKADARFLADMFIREKKTLKGDPEAIEAARRAIATFCNRLGYLCRDDGEVFDSAKAYLQGFREGGDFRLLAKTVNLLFPRVLRKQVLALWHSLAGPEIH